MALACLSEVEQQCPQLQALATTMHRALFSRAWQLRQAALEYMAAKLASGTLPRDAGSAHAKQLVQAAGPVLAWMLRDKVGGVVLRTMEVRVHICSKFAELCDGHGLKWKFALRLGCGFLRF